MLVLVVVVVVAAYLLRQLFVLDLLLVLVIAQFRVVECSGLSIGSV